MELWANEKARKLDRVFLKAGASRIEVCAG